MQAAIPAHEIDSSQTQLFKRICIYWNFHAMQDVFPIKSHFVFIFHFLLQGKKK